MTRAIAVAQIGDTIQVADGTYTGGADSESNYWTFGRANTTVTGASDYGATFTPAAAQARIFHFNAGGCTLGKINLDGAAVEPTNAVSFSSVADIDGLTINGTKIYNYKNGCIAGGAYLSNLTMTGGWLCQSANAAATTTIIVTPPLAGAINIQNGTINQTNVAGTTRMGISVVPVGAVSLTVKNVAITMTTAVDELILYGIYGKTCTSYDIGNNTINLTNDGDTTLAGVFIETSATEATSCHVYNNTGTLSSNEGFFIEIGSNAEADANANKISDILVYGNNFTGSGISHGYFVGQETGARFYNNKGTNATIGLISKHGTNNLFDNNLVIGGAGNMTGGALRDKASAGTAFYNNTVIAVGAGDVCLLTTQSDDTLTESTGSTFYNNLCYGTAASTGFKYTRLLNTSTVTAIDNNLYYGAGTLDANPWQYRATTYNAWADWKGGALSPDAAGVNADPSFMNAASDYRLRVGSPAKNTGSTAACTALTTATDYGTKTICTAGSYVGLIAPEIGAYDFPTTGQSAGSGGSLNLLWLGR